MNWLELSEQFAIHLESDSKCKGKRVGGGNIIRGHCPLPSHEDKQKSFAYFIQSAGYSCACGKGKASYLMDSLGWKHNGTDWKTAQPVLIATYDYKDEENTTLYQVLRFCPKKFYHRRPDGYGGYIDNIDGIRKLLYRLPELSTLEPGSRVLIVDGEKDVETAYKLGIPATCCSSGMHNWQDLFAAQFKDLKPTIVADKDADDSGRKAAAAVRESLKAAGIGANIIEMPGPMPPIKDLTDWVATGETKESLVALMEGPEIVPDAPKSIPELIALRKKLLSVEKVPLGLAAVDKLIGGGAIPGKLVIFGAFTGGGKTTVTSYISVSLANRGHPVLFLSSELSEIELLGKLQASIPNKEADIPNLMVWYPDLDITRVMEKVAVWLAAVKESKMCPVIVGDYLQKFKPDPNEKVRERQVASVVEAFQSICRRKHLITVLTAQLNRESKKEEKPQLHHFRESATIEQNADYGILIQKVADDRMWFMVGKNRWGRAGEEVEMSVDFERGTFGEVTQEQIWAGFAKDVRKFILSKGGRSTVREVCRGVRYGTERPIKSQVLQAAISTHQFSISENEVFVE